MTIKSLIGSAVLALSLTACTTQIIYADSHDSAWHDDAPGTSSFGPDVDPTTAGPGESENSTTGLVGSSGDESSSTGGESSETGAGSSSGSSTGSESSSTGGDSSSSSSTGEGSSTGGVMMPCPFSDACGEGGACAPDGTCVAACQEDGRCAGDELCLAGACVDVSDDMMEGQLVAMNDSPVGAVSSSDIDVWKVKIASPGNYGVTVSGKPVAAFILSGMGDIITTPADAEILDVDGVNARYKFTVEDSTLPIAVLLMSPSEAPVPYYFFTVEAP